MEFFVWANSNAAPFFSDESTGYVDADDPTSALAIFVNDYSHPAGLYAANVYASADAYHKKEAPLAMFVCDRASAREGLPHDCGTFTQLVGGNIEDGVDEHLCLACNERMAVTMR